MKDSPLAQIGSTLTFLAAFLLLVIGVATWRIEVTHIPPVIPPTLSPASISIGSIEANRLVKVSFNFINRDAKHAIKLFGVEDGCDRTGCVTVHGVPATIPPGANLTLLADFKGTIPGNFRKDITFYTDFPGKFSLVSTITADVVALKTTPTDAPKAATH